jgi:pimeloyl-ACP methyl ester carboxylesterase
LFLRIAALARGRVIKGAGHWLMEETPQEVISALIAFLNQQTTSTEHGM